MTVKHGGWYHVPRLALSGDGMIEVQVSTKMLYALTANQGGAEFLSFWSCSVRKSI